MISKKLKLISLLSFKENGFLLFRKFVSYFNPSTTIAHEILKEKIVLNQLLSTELSIYRGLGNTIEVNFIGHDKFRVLLRKYSSDYLVFDQILVHSEYQALVTFIKRNNSENNIMNIIDAGANIGLTTLYFKTIYNKSKIISVEPDLNNYEMLNRNIKINQFENIETVLAAVWHKNEFVHLNREFRDGKDWSISVDENCRDSLSKPIRGLQISEIMKENDFRSIDILKIDIEGAERFLFESTESVKSFLPYTRYLAMEVHNEFHILDKIKQLLEYFDFEYIFSGELIIARNRKLETH